MNNWMTSTSDMLLFGMHHVSVGQAGPLVYQVFRKRHCLDGIPASKLVSAAARKVGLAKRGPGRALAGAGGRGPSLTPSVPRRRLTEMSNGRPSVKMA